MNMNLFGNTSIRVIVSLIVALTYNWVVRNKLFSVKLYIKYMNMKILWEKSSKKKISLTLNGGLKISDLD